MAADKTFWVIQTGFLGDCILTLPFLYRLAERHPGHLIKIICRPSGRETFELAASRGLASPVLNARFETVVFDKRERHRGPFGFRVFLKSLGPQTPEAVFCLQRSVRSGLLAYFSRAQFRVGFSSGAASFLYNVFAPRDWDSGKSEVEKNLDLLRAYEKARGGKIVSDDAEPDFSVRPGLKPPGDVDFEWDVVRAPSLLKPGRELVKSASVLRNSASRERTPLESVALALGSPWATKRWNIDQAEKLVKDLTQAGVAIHLVGDAPAADIARELMQRVPSLLITNHCGTTTIAELIDILAANNALISNDSAPVHLAADINLPTVALFGPTVAEFGFAPWRRGSVAVGVKDLACRPCDIHGPMKCPLGHHKCMKELDADLVHRQLLRIAT